MLLSHHQNAVQNHDKESKQIVCKYCTVQIFGKKSNKSKFDSMKKLKADLILVMIPVISSEPFLLSAV
jgi:DNA-directed RNA polymerase subunit RPC12/RpoP